MTFAEALDSCPRLKEHYRAGLGALSSDRSRVTIRDTRRILGSVDVEAAQQEISGQAHTWDYGIGLRHGGEVVIWLEVHSANNSHVQAILDKLDSLINFLREHAAEMSRFPRIYVWLATRGVGIAPASRERRRLNARGIILKSQRLDLESVL